MGDPMTTVPGGGIRLDPTPLGAVRRTTTMVIAPRGEWAAGQTLTAIGRDLVRTHGDVVRSSHDELTFDIDPAAVLPCHEEQVWHNGARASVCPTSGQWCPHK